MRNRAFPVLLLGLAAALAGCAATPYVDSRREAGLKQPVGPSTPDLVAICYSPYGASAEAAQATAESECARTGRTAVLDRRIAWSCTFTAPTRVFYRCVAKP